MTKKHEPAERVLGTGAAGDPNEPFAGAPVGQTPAEPVDVFQDGKDKHAEKKDDTK